MIKRWLLRRLPPDTVGLPPAIRQAHGDEPPPGGAASILRILDDGAASFTFPMLDNGYVYLAATRLSLHRSETDWAVVFEVFGFSPRAGDPDLGVWTFGSRVIHGQAETDFVTPEAYRAFIAAHRHDEATFFHPVDGGDWQDPDDAESVAPSASAVTLRGRPMAVPARSGYARAGVALEDPARPRTFELCRYLADIARDDVLATPDERRVAVPPELAEILVLDAWRHPDLVGGELPSTSETFQQLAEVLATGEVGAYRPTLAPNIHWSNWPEGGRL